MGAAPAFASVGEAMDMARAALGYLAAVDATRWLPNPGRVPAGSWSRPTRSVTAAQASFLSAFTGGQGLLRRRGL